MICLGRLVHAVAIMAAMGVAGVTGYLLRVVDEAWRDHRS